MIKLCGFGVSNYYNKVKLVLMEKEIPFSEEAVFPGQEKSFLDRSPLGKIPFIETEQGCMSESQVILEYLEDAYPNKPLYPANAFEKAKCRELINHLELNVELQARRLYGEAFFGMPASPETKDEVKKALDLALKGVARLAKFSPYICGNTFTAADCVAWVHFFMVGIATEKVLGENLIVKYVPASVDYLKFLETRPQVAKASAERAAAIAAFMAPK
ncbi:MAG: glutathione S-transferase [Rugosibacter sp.]